MCWVTWTRKGTQTLLDGRVHPLGLSFLALKKTRLNFLVIVTERSGILGAAPTSCLEAFDGISARTGAGGAAG